MKQIPEGTRFAHYRFVAPNGSIVSQGGVTIAYRVDDAAGTVIHANAKCHIADNYNKNLGRVKAAGRTLSKRKGVFVGSEKDFLTQLDQGLTLANEVYRQVYGLQMERVYNSKQSPKALPAA